MRIYQKSNYKNESFSKKFSLLFVMLSMTISGCQNRSAEIDPIDSYKAGKGVNLEGLPAGADMIRANENAPAPIPIGEPSEGEEVSPTTLNGIKGS